MDLTLVTENLFSQNWLTPIVALMVMKNATRPSRMDCTCSMGQTFCSHLGSGPTPIQVSTFQVLPPSENHVGLIPADGCRVDGCGVT